MDFSKLFFFYLPFAKQNEAEVWLRFQILWSFCFELKVSNESQYSMPLALCTFGNVFSPSVQVQCANVQGGRVCRRQEGPATLPRCLPHRQWATGGRRGCSMRSPVKKDSLSSSLDLFMISFILFITCWPLAVGHSCTIRSPVKKISK